MKHWLLAVTVIIIILLGMTSASGVNTIPTPTFAPPTSTAARSEFNTGHDDLANLLHRKLCISYAELDNLSHKDLQQMVEKYADQLGAVVTKAKTDANGKFMTDANGIIIYEQVAGHGVFPVPDCQGEETLDVTPTPTAAPPLLPYPMPGR